MAERQLELIEDTVEEAPASAQTHNGLPPSSSIPHVQQSQPTPEPSPNASLVRNAVLDATVAHNQQTIAELERKVERKKETIMLLSNPPPIIPPPALGVVPPHPSPSTLPPGSAAPVSSAVQPPPNHPNPLSAAGNAVNPTQQQQHQSQPLAHNPAMAATMAAIAAASTPAVSAGLHPPYPLLLFPSPDNPVMASPFMGVAATVPPHHTTPSPVQPPASTTPSQPSQGTEDGANKQSRYWTPDEHQRFLAAVRTYGPKNYQQIAEVVGTRNARQVRTHSQKYQKKKERDEARRRGQGRIPTDVHSPVQTAAAPPTVTSDGTPTQNVLPQRGSNRAPATTSSKHMNPNETPQSAKSTEGSSSANNISSERNAESSVDPVHASAAAAAAAAVAAEARALGRGRLPPGAVSSLNKPHVAASPSSGLQAQKIRPREAKTAKPNGSSIPRTLNDATSTNPEKASEIRNRSIPPAVIHRSARTNMNAPRLEAKVATTIPTGSRAASNQVTKQVFAQKVHGSGQRLPPSRQPSRPSVNGSMVRPRVSGEKNLVPKLAPSPVKIEPRIVAPKPITGPLSGPCSNLVTAIRVKPSVISATAPSNEQTKTVSKSIAEQVTQKPVPQTKAVSKSIAEQVTQKPVTAVKNRVVKTEMGGTGPVTFNKDVPTLSNRKSEIVPNGKHGTQTLSQGASRVEPAVLNKEATSVSSPRAANTSPLPAASKQVSHSASARSQKLEAAGDACDPCDTSENDGTLDKSRTISPSKMKTAEQPSQQIPTEKGDNTYSGREAPQSSDSKLEISGKEGLTVSIGVLSAVSNFGSTGEEAHNEQKLACVSEGDAETAKNQAEGGSASTRSAGQVRGEIPGSSCSSKTETAKPCDGEPRQVPNCKSAAAPNQEKVVPEKRNQPDQVLGDTGHTGEGKRRKFVADTQVQKQCSNPGRVVGLAPSGREAIKSSLRPDDDTGKETKEMKAPGEAVDGPSSFENVEGQVDQTVRGHEAVHGGAARGQCDEEKSLEEGTNKAKNTDKTEERTGSEKEGSVSVQEMKKVDTKRPLENAAESVAKRYKGSDGSSQLEREEKENCNGINETELA